MRKESLPHVCHEVIECIVERLPVHSLMRFTAVSKRWKSTIESLVFQERHLMHREQSGFTYVLMVSHKETKEPLTTLVLGAPSSVKVDIPIGDVVFYCQSSCDGLVCLYNSFEPAYVINPATRWKRTLLLCEYQQIRMRLGLGRSYFKIIHAITRFALGKDKFTGTYKPVWLYNSKEIGLENETTCQVFDFTTDSWRHITPSAPYRIIGSPDPVYLDGSIYWFTACEEEKKVLCLDLHTEAFHIHSKAPSPFFDNANAREMVMSNLDNRLCVSVFMSPNQVIWSFDSCYKSWEKMCSIDVQQTPFWHSDMRYKCAIFPLALLKNKKKLLLCDRVGKRTLVTYELETSYYSVDFFDESKGNSICYFPSLISIV